MSGIAGIVNLDGAPVDNLILEKMTAALKRRGPNGSGTWSSGPAAMVHTLSISTPESRLEKQPLSMDNRTWITGDVRVDDRDGLIGKLKDKANHNLHSAPDIELVLRAWMTWGEEMMQHLLGDFSFAIWDDGRQTLFCARDHMGVKPFFYSHIGKQFVFSNTMNCLLLLPQVSTALNDQAIIDLLVFSFNTEFSTTCYRDICQLPPAHVLKVRDGKLELDRYWTLPVDPMLRYRRDEEYIEHFRTVFEQSVADRLRHPDISIFMSGGMDSTSVASVAHNQLAQNCPDFNLHLYTHDIGNLWPEDQEKIYAAQVANYLHVPHEIQALDKNDLFQSYQSNEWRIPEPLMEPLMGRFQDRFATMQKYAPVVLSGLGGDPVFAESPLYLYDQFTRRNWRNFFPDYWNYCKFFHRPSFLSARTLIKRRFEKKPWQPVLPPWLKPDVARQTDLSGRWQRWLTYHKPGGHGHPARPEAFADITSPLWPAVFQRSDAGTTGVPLEFRCPFFDVRLLRFMLQIPPVPWCVNKELLRLAMRGCLPEAVRLRTKTVPLKSPVHSAILQQDKALWQTTVTKVKNLSDYIDFAMFSNMATQPEQLMSNEAHLISNPIEVALWLEQPALTL